MNTNYRIFITGVSSIHGWPIYQELQNILPAENLFAIRPPSMSLPENSNIISLCITDTDGLIKIKNDFQPTHVIHCAGVCDLDICEDRPEWARNINVGGAENIRNIFGEDSYIIFMSTDLVFSGNNVPDGGYTEKDLPDPVSVAGKTFAEAEKVIQKCSKNCIIRLGLPLGDSVTGTKGAIDWIESRFKRNLPVTLFHDEWRSCVTCKDIGQMTPKIIENNLTGIYHFGGEESISLHQIGCMVLEKGNYNPKLLKKESRFNDINGPPRIGDVSLYSEKLKEYLFPKK